MTVYFIKDMDTLEQFYNDGLCDFSRYNTYTSKYYQLPTIFYGDKIPLESHQNAPVLFQREEYLKLLLISIDYSTGQSTIEVIPEVFI